MAKTHVNLRCHTAAQSDGNITYIITATVDGDLVGELPHAKIFLFQVIDTVDATRDVFTRVATPHDIENVATSRAEALTASQTYYLSSVLTREYNDLDVAVQAKDAVRSRIDNAINLWYSYHTEFFDGEAGVDNEHPMGDVPFEQALKTTYYEARGVRIKATTDSEGAVSAATAKSAEIDAQQIVVSTFLNEVEVGYRLTQYWNEYVGGVAVYDAEVANLIAAADANGSLDPSVASMNTVRNAFLTAVQANATALTPELSTFYGAADTAHRAAVAQLNNLRNALETLVTAKNEAAQAIVAAQAIEDEALANVRDICPDFIPVNPDGTGTTILLCDQ